MAAHPAFQTSETSVRPTCAAISPRDGLTVPVPASLDAALPGALAAAFPRTPGPGQRRRFRELRAPKQPKSLPKPLTAIDAKRVVSAGEQLAEEPWIAARNAAVLTLLYGSGLRISEALNLSGTELASPSDTVLRITGKGGKTRLVPVLPVALQAVAEYRKLCPYHLAAEGALFRGARGGQLDPAIIQREMRKMRSALNLPDTATRTRCATPSPPICSAVAATCAPSRSCSATPVCRPRRSIRASTQPACSRFTTRHTPRLTPRG